MKKFSVSLAEALANGYVIIPNMIFAYIIAGSEHLKYIMPFVLLYSFQKAGVYLIQGFGQLNNPYKALEAGLSISIAGCLLCIFFPDNMYIFDIGATLIGLGLSNYSALFKTIKDRKKADKTWNYGKSLLYGYLMLFGIIGFVALSMKKFHWGIQVILLFLILMFIIINGAMWKMKMEDPLGSEKAFIKRKNAWRYFIPAILILVTTFFIRLLKQTAEPYLLTYIAIAFCIIILISFFYSKTTVTNYTYQTVWFGALRNYMVIFSLIYFIAIDRGYLLELTYLFVITGLIFSMKAEPALRKKWGPAGFNRVCIYGGILSTFLIFNIYTYFMGIFLAGMFSAMGNRINIHYFVQKETIPVTGRRIVRAKLYNFGAILQQTVLLTVIVGASLILYGNGSIGLAAYDLKMGSSHFENIFTWTRAACSLVILVTGVLLDRGLLKDKNNRAQDQIS